MIPADDPVRLLSACVEGMDLSELYDTYDRIRKNQATPKQLFKIIVYANMNRLYSSRDIEKACRQNINYMYLLEGKPAPDHATDMAAAPLGGSRLRDGLHRWHQDRSQREQIHVCLEKGCNKEPVKNDGEGHLLCRRM